MRSARKRCHVKCCGEGGAGRASPGGAGEGGQRRHRTARRIDACSHVRVMACPRLRPQPGWAHGAAGSARVAPLLPSPNVPLTTKPNSQAQLPSPTAKPRGGRGAHLVQHDGKHEDLKDGAGADAKEEHTRGGRGARLLPGRHALHQRGLLLGNVPAVGVRVGVVGVRPGGTGAPLLRLAGRGACTRGRTTQRQHASAQGEKTNRETLDQTRL